MTNRHTDRQTDRHTDTSGPKITFERASLRRYTGSTRTTLVVGSINYPRVCSRRLGGLFKCIAQHRFPSVAAEGGCVVDLCVVFLDGLARGKTKGKSWIVGSAWPTGNSVPEPLGRAMGGLCLGLRTGI